MPSIRSDLVGVIYLPGGARLSAGDPVPPGEVVGAHLIEGAEPAETTAEAVEPQPEPEAEPAEATVEAVEPQPEPEAEPAEATAEALEPQPEPVAPRPATSRTRKRSSGRAR
ncbi:hypothetical protein [Mycobacteroides chelonae]|uniref:hypothetical protein n=1 Tax=Mycobacteroides chelonae TaxID=1774 RepID=UPI0009929F3D|nr:hypothetical protein [Mycobacteroides chelonae]